MAADRYLDNSAVGANDANGGTNFTPDAKATMAGIDAIDTAGDRIFIGSGHSELTAAAVSYSFAGTAASPQQILSCTAASSPPTVLAAGAIIATSGNTSSITVAASEHAYMYGVTFDIGQGGTGTANFIPTGQRMGVDTCTFKLSSTGASCRVNFGNSSGGFPEVVNCSFRFSAAGHSISSSIPNVKIRGGSVLAGGTSPTSLFTPTGTFEVEGFDLSACAAGVNMCSVAGQSVTFKMRDCKMPASWSGVLNSATPGLNSRFEMFNCDGADTHYRYRLAGPYGTGQDETTIVKTGGSTDGTTTYSVKLISNATCKYPAMQHDGPEMQVWNTTVGAPVTVTVDIVHDSVTALKDDEVFLDVMYLGTSGVPLATLVTDAKTGVLTAGANQTASTATWTTTGLANPNKQQLSVTVTPQEEGFFVAKVRMTKPSYTLYQDMQPVLS